MSLLIEDFEITTKEFYYPNALKFKSEIPNEFTGIFEYPVLFDFRYLNEVYEKISISEVKVYVSCLILIRFSKELIEYCSESLSFFEFFVTIFKSSTHSNSFWRYYSHLLTQQISLSDESDLVNWSCKLIAYKKIPNLSPVISWLTSKLASKVYSSYSLYLSEPSSSKVEVIVTELYYLINLSDIQNEILDSITLSILNDIENLHYLIKFRKSFELYNENCLNAPENGLDNLKSMNISELKKSLSCFNLIQIFMNTQNKIKFKSLRESLQVQSQFEKKLKNSFENELILFNDFDVDLVALESKVEYERIVPDKFTVKIAKGSYKNSNIVVKTYSNFNENFKIENSNIYKEIEIMIYLSNRADRNKMLIKLLYYTYDNSHVTLYMEDGGVNLMEYLSQLKKNSSSVPEFIYERWIVELIETFSWMANNKIYHCDIKPHNLVVDQHNQIKIIDFGISLFSEQVESTLSETVIRPIQGTEGYLAPEIEELLSKGAASCKFRPGKADVFSLGMTILQIITLEKYSGYNKNDLNNKLIQKVANLNIKSWIKDLLISMLAKDRSERPSFNKCLALLDQGKTLIG